MIQAEWYLMIYGVKPPAPKESWILTMDWNYGIFYMGKCESWVLWGLSLWRLYGDVRRIKEEEEREEKLVQYSSEN